MIEGRAFVTPHAIAQFRERIDCRLSEGQARKAILMGLERAGPPVPSHEGRGVLVRVRSEFCGYPYDFRAVLVPGEGELPAVATVLRSGR